MDEALTGRQDSKAVNHLMTETSVGEASAAKDGWNDESEIISEFRIAESEADIDAGRFMRGTADEAMAAIMDCKNQNRTLE